MGLLDQNKVNTVFQTAFENLSNITDVGTVVGKPIKLDENTTVLPVSKVTFGILSGGGEYGKTGVFKSSNDLPFSAGNGTIVSLKPFGFLVKEQGNFVKLISTEKENFEKILDIAYDLIEKFKVD